ncbi:hypothetical protein GBA52_025095 [Prunus armeniaca]|nr:hypothetical protein GBA52_025095 [Prunus armeniaca]
MARNLVVLIRQLLGNRNHPCAAGFLHHLHDKPIQNLTSVPNTASSSPIRVDIRFALTQLFQSLRQGHDPSATLLSDSDQFQIFYFQVAQTYSSLIASSSVTMHLIKLKVCQFLHQPHPPINSTNFRKSKRKRGSKSGRQSTVIRKIENSRVGASSSKTSKDSMTPLRNYGVPPNFFEFFLKHLQRFAVFPTVLTAKEFIFGTVGI